MGNTSDKVPWVSKLRHGEASKSCFARLIEEDPDQTELYEHFADPTVAAIERDQRRYRGMFRRRLRHLASKRRRD